MATRVAFSRDAVMGLQSMKDSGSLLQTSVSMRREWGVGGKGANMVQMAGSTFIYPLHKLLADVLL